MNGELILKGYKFPEKLILNLLNKTILTGDDCFTAFEVFNMIENYFNRRSFSDFYLDNGTVLILNGNKLSGDEFAVFRISPTVNLSEELKITKKSILGQVVQTVLTDAHDNKPLIADALQESISRHINSITKEYGVSFDYEGDDIFTLTKILIPVVKSDKGQEIFAKEHNQFFCKALILDLISRLDINKKILLLVEYPEYGLRESESVEFLNLLLKATIDNVIIYTHDIKTCKLIPYVFNYNVVKNGSIYGFDDYDELEKQLQQVLINRSIYEIQQKVMEYIFHPKSTLYAKDEFAQIVDDFLS